MMNSDKKIRVHPCWNIWVYLCCSVTKKGFL